MAGSSLPHDLLLLMLNLSQMRDSRQVRRVFREALNGLLPDIELDEVPLEDPSEYEAYSATTASKTYARFIARGTLLHESPENHALISNAVALLAVVLENCEQRDLLEDAARRAERDREHLFEMSIDLLCVMAGDGEVVEANPAWETVLGWPVPEIVNRGIVMLVHPDDRESMRHRLETAASGTIVSFYENRMSCADGTYRWLSWNWRPDPDTWHIYAVARDITERKRMEEEQDRLRGQLAHAQKMEAVGTLAGGIAHDFNNMLTGILGYADLVRSITDPSDARYEGLAIIEESARRATRLTRQLVGFARKGKLRDQSVDLHTVIRQTVAMLERTMERDIRIALDLAARRSGVRGDQSQLEQVVLNLVVNARDAMPGGGELKISTANEAAPAAGHTPPHASAGETCVVMSVADTGVGIPEGIRARVFEPFFTTKDVGVGSGMGLAMVYGIVTNHGGGVDLQSEPGSGTTFRCWLPLEDARDDGRGEGAPSSLEYGEGTILVVDDELAVRQVAGSMLTSLGYQTEFASNGVEAVEYVRGHQGEISLVLLDLTMPVMNGNVCFYELRRIDPTLKIVIMTGHSMSGSGQRLIDDGALGFVNKPFVRSQLGTVIGTALRDSRK